MELQNLANNLEYKDGIWFSRENKKTISYPPEGNQNSFTLEENSFWFEHRNQCIVKLVKNFSPDSYLFDIGGGNGFVSQALEKEGINTVLVEPGEQGVLNAKKRNLKNLICSTVEEAEFHSDAVPSIGLFDVLEHIEKDELFLKKLHKLLVSNGKIYISVPSYRFLWSSEDDLAGHYHRYTLKTLRKSLLGAGYTILYSTYIFSYLPIPIFLLRSIPSKLGWSKKKIEIKDHQRAHERMPMLEKVHRWELKQISKLKTIPFGGSCLLVATKGELNIS